MAARGRALMAARGRALMAARGCALAAVLGAAGLLAVTGCAAEQAAQTSPASSAAVANPNLDLGTSMHGVPAPDIRLVNQFGQPMALSQFRGKVVILAFVDSQCTTVCPLTTSSMVEAKNLLGTAGTQVQLLGVNANPQATSVAEVRAYSVSHGMINQWDFLTGSEAQLETTWRAYHIADQIDQGQIDHTPALLVIDARGREQKIYLTQMAYASVDQAAQVLAEEVARLLPGRPRLRELRSVAYLPGLGPARRQTLAAAPGGPVTHPITLGPGQPRMIVFFATWLQETSDLRAQLAALNVYARQPGLPRLVAIDETTTEPSAAAVSYYLRHLRHPLRYPVALDPTGRVADGYGAADQPWFALVNGSGRIVWHHAGWLQVRALMAAASRA